MYKPLSPFFWLWIPIAGMIIQAILEISLSDDVLHALHSENGPHELLQCVVMVIALIVALSYFFTCRNKTALLNSWFGLATICSLYVAGEELSWGQQVLNWSTPEYWSGVNDQNETNLHNTSSWLDQKPRLILEIGIVVGTLILGPLYRKGRLKLPENLGQLLPPKELSIIALLVIVPQLAEKFFEAFDIILFARFSEVQELYMFYFVLLYVVMLKKRVSTKGCNS